ncbi:hypothetical protein [Paucisalibacillus globulus]|uniref:hypothetical protein n=1 Tax=Paucisalibacillus globulus TaxID=351095 RepID=UPI00041F3AC5|nr:hypothetical protein [Paucisalibacillus globulus]
MIFHKIKGTKATTYFDFQYDFTDGIFTISKGSYYINNELRYESNESFTCEIQKGKYYNFVLVESGIIVIHEWSDEPIIGLIDILAWGDSTQMEAKLMV